MSIKKIEELEREIEYQERLNKALLDIMFALAKILKGTESD